MLVSKFKEEDPRLYRSMFLYDSNSNDMGIAISRCIFSWLAEHADFYDIVAAEDAGFSDVGDKDVAIFISTYRLLCQRFIVHEDVCPGAIGEVFEKLVQESIAVMDSLLHVSKKYDDRLERLRYQSEKSAYLFDRALADFSKENP